MAQTYTLEEAAEKLGIAPQEFKRRLRTEWKHVHSYQDGTTTRFKANVIDELARTMGLGSDDDLKLGDSDELDLPTEIMLADDKPKSGKTPPPAKKGKSSDDEPLKIDSDEVFLLSTDDPKPKKNGSDSDVRLEKSGKHKRTDDEESIMTEELEIPSAGGSSGKLSGKSGKLSSARLKSGDSGKQKAPAPQPDSSEFELSLDPDSDEFELSLDSGSSEEASIGEMPPTPKGKKSAQSGINLGKPADSGLSLEKNNDSDDEIDFELSLETPGSGASSKKLNKSKLEQDSDSEFELTLEEPSADSMELGLDDKQEGDIFEATDFEIPALDDDSASEAVSLDEGDTDLESSDFEISLDDAAAGDDESASQVVALDDEDDMETRPKSKKGMKAKKAADTGDSDDVDFDDMELEEGSSASSALRGVRRGDDDEEYEVSVAADEGSAAPAKWGALPLLMLAPTFLVLFVGGLLAYELLHSVWGYQQSSTPATPLVSAIADAVGMKPGQ